MENFLNNENKPLRTGVINNRVKELTNVCGNIRQRMQVFTWMSYEDEGQYRFREMKNTPNILYISQAWGNNKLFDPPIKF